LEVNPRASRTVPFVSKATGRPLAKIAARCMAGTSLKAQGIVEEIVPDYYCVKEAVFPFVKFPGVDPLLSPEMKSTGEVMGVGATFGEAFAKSQNGASNTIPLSGKAFVSVKDSDKETVVEVARGLIDNGFELVSTSGTQRVLEAAGLACERVNKVNEGRPHIVDKIKNREIHLIVNTTEGKKAIADSFSIRREALHTKVTYYTTISGALALVEAVKTLDNTKVRSLQDLHG